MRLPGNGLGSRSDPAEASSFSSSDGMADRLRRSAMSAAVRSGRAIIAPRAAAAALSGPPAIGMSRWPPRRGDGLNSFTRPG